MLLYLFWIIGMKFSIKKIFISLLILLLLVFLGRKFQHWYLYGQYLEQTDNAYVKADSVAIRAELSGRVTSVVVTENQQVRKGQLLINIDDSAYKINVMKANANLVVNRAMLANAQAQFVLQQKTLAEADANIDAVRAELHRSQLELARFKVLAKHSFDSKQQLENSTAAVTVANAKVAQAIAAKASAVQMLSVLQTKINSQQAQCLVAQAELDYAQNQLTKTAIVAPSSGVIGDLGVHVGSSAQPMMTLLYLVPLPNIYVVANYKETQITHMTIGQPVTLTVDAQPDITFTGVVASLSPATGTEFSLLPRDNATGNFNKIVQRVPVRIRVTGPSDALSLLRPGLSVVPAVDTRSFSQQVSYLSNTNQQNMQLAEQ